MYAYESEHAARIVIIIFITLFENLFISSDF
jgi:hypothetical protein